MKSLKNTNLLIYSYQKISLEDINVLTLLYAPLIGSNSLHLYLTLSSLITKSNLTSISYAHKDLFDILNMKEVDFLEARYKLEAIGLIESYTDELDNYYYILFLPQTAKSFIKSGVLGIYLNSQIGSTNLENILSYFKCDKVDTAKLNNISKSFDQVFETTNINKSNISDNNLADNVRSKSINLSSNSFDIDSFINSIDTNFVQTSLELFKTNIVNVAVAYNIDINDMINLYNQSIYNNKFSQTIFKRKARMLYGSQNKDNVPYLKTNNNIAKSELDETIDIFKNISAQELLDKYSLNTLKNVNNISEIYESIPYNRTIVNMMIYSVIGKLNELPKVGYFESMYNTMKECGIEDETSAYLYLFTTKDKDKQTFNKKIVKKRSNIKENNPDWVKSATDNILKGFNSVKDDE